MRFSAFYVLTVLFASLALTSCDEAQTASAPSLPQVTAAHPLVKTINDWDNFVGQFEAVERVEIRPRVTGYLVEVYIEDGQMVSAGDKLFRIDSRPFDAALSEAQSRVTGAQSRLENARTELERARGLVEVKAISQEEFDSLNAAMLSATSELEAARAATRAAELDVDFTTIVAPISGRASYRRVDVGNAVIADETVLTTLVSLDPIHFSFQGSEADYLKYKRNNRNISQNNTPVRIRLQDEDDYRWPGQLDFLDNAIDPESGTIRGRAVLNNPDGFLTPGMFGHMQLQATAAYDGILLPDTAIATRGAQRIVYVVDEAGMVTTQEVEPGPLNEGLRVIRSGLAAEDVVIIDGLQRARPGAQVAVTMSKISDPADAVALTTAQ
jgi:RND family efflux transporter MFP subunit